MAKAANSFNNETTGLRTGRGGFMRAANGTPYVTDPTGALTKTGERKGLPKRIAYGSPSSFGKLIENTTNLQKWGERRVVLGVGADLTLVAECAALTKLDVDSDEYKQTADRIVVAAKNAAEASLAADRGTHGHAILEDDDEGRPWLDRAANGELLGIPVEAQHNIVSNWRAMLKETGLEILETEAACVDDVWKLAGTLDNTAQLGKALTFVLGGGEIVTIPAGTILVVDKKTGQKRTNQAGAIQYWHGYAIQVASYAQSVPYDTVDEERGTWGYDISQQHALIAHIDIAAAIDGADTGLVTLVYVDLNAGREHGGRVCAEAKEWAKRNDLFSTELHRIGDPELVNVGGATPSVVASDDETLVPAPVSKLRAAQNERLTQTKAAERPSPRRPLPSEGADLSDAQYKSSWDALAARFSGGDFAVMSDTARAVMSDAARWRAEIVRQARQAGVSIQTDGGLTARRFDLYRAIVGIMHEQERDDIMRALIEAATGRAHVLNPAIPLGEALGQCNHIEANMLVRFVDAYQGGMLVCGFDLDGRFVVMRINNDSTLTLTLPEGAK